jgi:hypothetical protein
LGFGVHGADLVFECDKGHFGHGVSPFLRLVGLPSSDGL